MSALRSQTSLLKRVIRFGTQHPRQLFLVDGAGAVLSALMLGVVLIRLESFFGVPPRMLLILATFPALFALYDLGCFVRNPRSPVTPLRIIGMLNLFYVLISVISMAYHAGSILLPGWISLISEVLIVTAIGFAELHISRQLASVGRVGVRHQ